MFHAKPNLKRLYQDRMVSRTAYVPPQTQQQDVFSTQGLYIRPYAKGTKRLF